MCGITGKIYFDNREVSANDLEKMNTAIRHRGPDDSGTYISPDKKTGLGHLRLSIIDLSPLGHQPMSYLSRYWIVFNGEIYNYQEKRVAMEKAGYRFKSHSDTEIIMALYDKYREDCLEHLRGMFAFAIYDEKEKTIFCARDRVGKKPFKYYLDDKVFLFASELKAILTQKEYQKEPDFEAISHYLTFQYCPAPLTGFKDIRKLAPAHYLKIDLATKTVVEKSYWKLDYSKKLALPEKEWSRRIMEKLEESVRLRMIADVPLGAFLSGGIDSSAIVGLMSKLSDQPVKTFSIGFAEEKYNELKYAKMIAERFKTDHTEFIVKPNAIAVLPMLVHHYEEPFSDSSALPTYYVSKLTREHVTVALNGDGGDENFAGYSRYEFAKKLFLLEKLKYLGMAGEKIFTPLSQLHQTMAKLNRASSTVALGYQKGYTNLVAQFLNKDKERFLSDQFKKDHPVDSYSLIEARFKEAGTKDKLDQTLYADFTTYLPDALMAKVDIATMAVALEGRSPLLDHELLELSAKIPSRLKLKGKEKKYIFKKALEDLLPPEVLYRPKMGFGIPLDIWFRGELKEYAKEKILASHPLKNRIFNLKEVEKMLDEHASGKLNHAYKIWNLLTLSLWFEEYFK